MIVSIIVCTYNRSDRLACCLHSLERLTIPQNADYEVVVVDNNSGDETKQLVGSFVGRNPRFRCLFEQRQGQSFALNTGIRAARGEVISFTDDDCIANHDWLERIVYEFSSDTSLSVLGGRVERFSAGDAPVALALCDSRTVYAPLEHLTPPLMIGANMSFRKNVFDVIGGYDVAFGPGTKANAVIADVDLIHRAHRKGFKVLFSPEIRVLHNHGRTTAEQVQEVLDRASIGRGAFYCKHILNGDWDILKVAYWELIRIMKTRLLREYRNRPLIRLSALFRGAAYEMRLHWADKGRQGGNLIR